MSTCHPACPQGRFPWLSSVGAVCHTLQSALSCLTLVAPPVLQGLSFLTVPPLEPSRKAVILSYCCLNKLILPPFLVKPFHLHLQFHPTLLCVIAQGLTGDGWQKGHRRSVDCDLGHTAFPLSQGMGTLLTSGQCQWGAGEGRPRSLAPHALAQAEAPALAPSGPWLSRAMHYL